MWKETLTPTTSTGVSYLTAGNNPGIGVVISGVGGGTANRYTGFSIFFKPTVPMHSAPIITNYSNIAGWQSCCNYDDMGDGWYRAHVIWYDTVTRSDGKYWAINPLSATLNVPIEIYWAGPFKEDRNDNISVSSFVDGTRGATVATGGGWADRTANANHGELVNGPTYNSANGGRIVFDGVDDYIDLGSNLQLSNNFTLCVWHINPNTGYIIDQGDIGGDPTNSLEYTNYGLTLSANNNSSVTADGTITTTRWNFICTTFSSATTKFYINGILDSTKTASFSSFTPSGKLKIGRRAFSTSSIFSGSIGMVMVYNKVLTDSEILQNYNAQKSRFGLP